MRAVVLRSYGGPEVLTITDVPDPIPAPDEVLVEVRTTALNRADLLQRQGRYPGPPAAVEIPGIEYSGTVVAVGTRVRDLAVGDAVMGLVGGGAYAERVAVHERLCLRVPATVGVADAAAIPEVFITAWDALVLQGGLTSGRWALVHAGGSGVGTAAIQIARAIGARVAVTCSAPKLDACIKLGANVALERSPSDWLSALRAAVPGGVDVVLDVVGGDETDRDVDALTPALGRIVQVGTMAGAGTLNVAKLMPKRAAVIGTVLRARAIEEKITVTRRFADEVLPLFDAGVMTPVIDTRFPLERIADAHAHMEANANVGKILVDVSPSPSSAPLR